MTEELSSLLDFADSKKWDFVAMDQGLIISYFGPTATRLPDNYNWKPYWGINHDAVIVHFHGFKPSSGKYAQCIANSHHHDHSNMTAAFQCGVRVYNTLVSQSLSRKYVSNYSDISRSYHHYFSMHENLTVNMQHRIESL